LVFAIFIVNIEAYCHVQMTINQLRAEKIELNNRLYHEQQKTERQLVITKQQDNQLRELHVELKVDTSSWTASRDNYQLLLISCLSFVEN